jgi:cyclopropane fatty-acyl-phospholipid synthase-like methyltransferase
MNAAEKYRLYWGEKRDAGHGTREEEFYRSYGAELRILYAEITPHAVLEIGCGSGVLFPYLGFDVSCYRGVDFSPTMLEEFHKRIPQATLVCEAGHSYRDEGKYELIFSNQVIQHFESGMLDLHLRNARAMLADGGKVVIGSTPWDLHRGAFYSGAIYNHPTKRSVRSVIGAFRRWTRGDIMGRWYSLHEIETLARKHGFRARFYGCMHFPYRFHSVLVAETEREYEKRAD